jgi:hypothetical protein
MCGIPSAWPAQPTLQVSTPDLASVSLLRAAGGHPAQHSSPPPAAGPVRVGDCADEQQGSGHLVGPQPGPAGA